LLVAIGQALLRTLLSKMAVVEGWRWNAILEFGEDPSELLAMDDLLMKMPSSSEITEEVAVVFIKCRGLIKLSSRCSSLSFRGFSNGSAPIKASSMTG